LTIQRQENFSAHAGNPTTVMCPACSQVTTLTTLVWLLLEVH